MLFVIYDFSECDRPSFRFGEAKYLRSEIKRVDELMEAVGETLNQVRLDHKKELVDVLHTKLGDSVNFVEAGSLMKREQELASSSEINEESIVVE